MISEILEKVVPPAGILAAQAQATTESFAAHVEMERQNLRDAFRKRDVAQVEVAECTATIERIEDLITQADMADAALRTAEKSSADFTRAWAEAGAVPGKPRVNPALAERAHVAHRAAIDAAVAGDGAKAGLPAAKSSLYEAQNRLEAANDSIRQLVGRVLRAKLAPAFEMARQAAATFTEAADEIQACARALAGNWHPYSANAIAFELLSELRASMPPAPPSDTSGLIHKSSPELMEHSKKYASLAGRLLSNADAD